MRTKFLFLLVTTVLLTSFIGCGTGADKTLDVSDFNKTNILKLRNSYEMYLATHGMRGPENEDELKEYLRTDEAAKVRLKRMGIEQSDIESMFISERDGKPFRVRYGLVGLADHAIVFEEEGVDGKRLVALAQPLELSDSEYEGWFTGKTKPAMPNETDIDGTSEAEAQKSVED
ncbi:MAG: hypothetical protein AAF939_16890 [Planctomycetota bacterium]